MENGAFAAYTILIDGIGGLAYFAFQLWQEKTELQAKIDNTEIREGFAKAIFNSSAKEEELGDILGNFFPRMFPDYEIQFWMFLERALWNTKADSHSSLASISAWMLGREGI
jgi:hypothetical protein